MEFEVATANFTLFPTLSIYNEWGTEVLWATDTGTEWHGKPRPAGRYRVTAWVPAHCLAAGAMTITAAVKSFVPKMEHFREPDAVSFQAIESSGDGSARGSFSGYIGSVTRPKLEWCVDYEAGT